MAPGPDNGTYVSIFTEGGPDRGHVVALLDKAGKPSPGWPVLLPGVYGCDLLLPVDDGSVRVVCDASSGDVQIRRVFALDANARLLPGWPIDVGDIYTGRMIGTDLRTVEIVRVADGATGPELVHMLTITEDGTTRRGVDLPTFCCDFFIGPDGTGWATGQRDWDTSVKTDVAAFDLDGPRAGWPRTFDSNASTPAFDAAGHFFMVVGSPIKKPDRTVVLDRDGRILPAGSDDLSIVSSTTRNGAGDTTPGEPTVAADGTAFVVNTAGGATTIVSLDPSGQPRAGWPYRSALQMQWEGFCGDGDTGCGQARATPAVGSRNTLYLLQAASGPSTGGSIVAIGADGHVLAGWPVRLTRAGSQFASITVAPDGGVWALAIEPESRGYSATVLSIAADSSIRYSTTLVQP
ncbi:MAG: hypothetical protein ABI553_03540 [Chloroflexota bacterium]